MSLTSGARLGPYEVTGRIGAGGMGEVYRARDTRLGRGSMLPSGSVVLDYPSWSPGASRIYFDVTRKTGDIYVLGGD